MKRISRAAREFGHTPNGRGVTGVEWSNAGGSFATDDTIAYTFRMKGDTITGWSNYKYLTHHKQFLDEFATFITAKTGIAFPSKDAYD